MIQNNTLTKNTEVLIIDDDAASRAFIAEALESGYGKTIVNVMSAPDAGADSLRRSCTQKSFDCVFLAHNPPALDAVAMLRAVYDPESDLGKCPVVILAARGKEKSVLDALHFGAQDYLLKENLSFDMLNIAMLKAQEVFEIKRGRHQAQDELQQARKMEAVGRLTSGVAHDFNNLLTVVTGNIHLLRRRFVTGVENYTKDDILDKITAIDDVAQKGAELVRRLMVFTRQSPLAQEVVSVNTCIAETIELLKRTLGEAIEIETIPSPHDWKTYLDPIEFENILINFAVNARDAMPHGGKLTIETENLILDDAYTLRHPSMPPGAYIMIAISDTGTGMSSEVLKNVFEPFFTTKPPGEGTGLGMSMAYGFIRQCGGHLHVYSELGHGTVFRIYLPRLASESDSEPVAEPAASPVGRETVLVAEDDDDVRAVAVNMLEKLGYHTLQAKNGRMALEILKREHRRIDVLFTDIVMPGDLNGIDLVREMRDYYPEIKVLYTSGYTENAIPNYQFCAGEELISKPYRREVLAMKLRKLIDGSGNER